MKRRDILRLTALSFPGMSIAAEKSHSFEKSKGKDDPLALRYLRRVSDMLRWIRATQSENMLEASYAAARTVKSGGAVFSNWDMGHSNRYDVFPERNGVPSYISMGYDSKKVKRGDIFITSRYGNVEDIRKKDILVVGCPCPWGGDAKGNELLREDVRKEKVRPYAKIWVETNITTHGAIMKLPGRPAPFGPVSGMLGLVTFWMMMADASRILARDGVSMKVSGDEKALSGDADSTVNLHEPLLDHYFDTVMGQMQMIEAEYGEIRRVARIAADTALAGGKVYCYSRYRNSLASEGHHRRGGLALTRGVCEQDGVLTSLDGYVPFKGAGKDCVIMGVWEPDDEIDLKNLDAFRNAGMKVASIGPTTRDIKIPDGRSVPKESDVHVGRMCDTYGLYALPGFERKVCPTSGPVINQIWWAICMEIAEEIIRRTGNSPGAFKSGALDGGREYNNLLMYQYHERGY